MTFLLTCIRCSKKDPDKLEEQGYYAGAGVTTCPHVIVKEKVRQYVWVIRK